MPLQTDNLGMIGLSSVSNQPPNPFQLPLRNGVHCRWSFRPELGFPWHGFYLFRRPAQSGTPLCLANVIGGLTAGPLGDNKYYTALGLISSDNNLVLTDNFALSGRIEFDLIAGSKLRFDLPQGEPARRVIASIGFHQSGNVEITAISGETQVQKLKFNGQEGEVVDKTLEFDVITAIEITGRVSTALVDLCYVPVAQGATQDWQKLPTFTYPMGLPVTHPEYPCTLPEPKKVWAVRVPKTDALPPNWNKDNKDTFSELHSQLQLLVAGGPGSQPMADRVYNADADPSDPNSPKLNKIPILDLILIGSLHPVLARGLGLYWIDQSFAPGVAAYDYLIVADHTGIGKRDADNVLSTINTSGFTELDGYIVFNKKWVNDPELPPPGGLRTFALPGGTFPNAQGELPAGTQNAGLCWDLGLSSAGELSPDRPVMYLAWRSDMGNAETPGTATPYNLVTKLTSGQPKPILVTESRLPNGLTPERASNWPPFPLHYIDRNLLEGWYSYQVSGIDLFGRHSKNSPPSVWYQWQIPANEPAPWYYESPSKETNVKLPGSPAIRLLDKIPPPMPTAVEAYALDPDDSYLVKDDAYQSWYETISPETLIGVRVRWTWTKAHQRQAPDTREFRLYFNLGPDPPIDRDQAVKWQERYHVVGYNESFSSIDPTNQTYGVGGGLNSIKVTAASGYKWWVVSDSPWIHIISGSSGSGNGIVTYAVGMNAGAVRTGTLRIAGHTFIVYQQDSSSNLPASQPVSSKEDRVYEIFRPLAPPSDPTGLSVKPTLDKPIVYAHIGVSAADDKPHTKDLLKPFAAGNLGSRTGNEGSVGPPAKIFCVLRTPPPIPEAIMDGERFYFSPADYNSRSSFTYRWKPQQYLKLHVFRAMDDAVFKADWSQRPLKEPLSASEPNTFPIDWNQATRQSIADELNHLNDFIDPDRTAKAMAYYRQLSDKALRVLAGLPSSASAFVQLTINPLDPDDPANANRKGPDITAEDVVLDDTQRAFVDTLDGRSTNRYFYRAAFVDAAHNLGKKGLASPPVYLRKVVPPRPPIMTKICGGERQIELYWVRSLEEGISAYRVYRTSDMTKTNDLRRMELVQDLPTATLNPNFEASWTDKDVDAGIDFYYRLIALDSENPPNESGPSQVAVGRSVDTVPPKAPELVSAEWVIFDTALGTDAPWPTTGSLPPGFAAAVRLTLLGNAANITISKKNEESPLWQEAACQLVISNPPQWVFLDLDCDPDRTTLYRVIATNSSKMRSPYSNRISLQKVVTP